jgi:nitrate reductase NapAB chaperone NapD
MADDKLSSERFAPGSSVSNFERHVVEFQNLNGVTVTHADEDDGQIAMVMSPGDTDVQDQAEKMGKDRMYNITSGVRDDVGKYVVVLEEKDRHHFWRDDD